MASARKVRLHVKNLTSFRVGRGGLVFPGEFDGVVSVRGNRAAEIRAATKLKVTVLEDDEEPEPEPEPEAEPEPEPEAPLFICPEDGCGFEAKSKAGLARHHHVHDEPEDEA